MTAKAEDSAKAGAPGSKSGCERLQWRIAQEMFELEERMDPTGEVWEKQSQHDKNYWCALAGAAIVVFREEGYFCPTTAK